MKLHIAVGDKFGSWMVVEQGPKGSHNRARKWIVRCDCGKVTEKSANALMSGTSRRCRQCDGLTKRAPMEIGQRFGHLVIESQAESRTWKGKSYSAYRSFRWNCRCDCGRLAVVAGFLLRKLNGTRQCRMCARKVVGLALRLPEGVVVRNNALSGIRGRARKRGCAWELDDETFDRLIQLSCIYCGCPPRNQATNYDTGATIKYSGIDRVDSSKGYTKENSVPCCGRCNRWKSDAAVEDFKAHVKRIYENLEKHNAGPSNT